MKPIKLMSEFQNEQGWTFTVYSIELERLDTSDNWETIVYLESERGTEEGPEIVLNSEKLLALVRNGTMKRIGE